MMGHLRSFLLTLLGFLCFFNQLVAQNLSTVPFVPKPVSVQAEKGRFTLDAHVKIVCLGQDPSLRETAEYLSEQVGQLCGIHLKVVSSSKPLRNCILLGIEPTDKKESYRMNIEPKKVVLTGSDPSGLFYAVQSLLQLIEPNKVVSGKMDLPALQVSDAPAFAWRGMHLDVCRHFFPVSFIKRMLDQMAHYKLNTFHWHLTDDQGWRIEIKRYPLLTTVGGWRDETLVGRYTVNNQKFDGIRYGGFYTQDEIREVVVYAKKLHITVVPEIEMPGHAVAALSAYPQFSCTGGPFKPYTVWGVSDDVYCAGKEETFTFLQQILDEVIPLFPGTYVHIGGDECPKTRWKACPDCQKRMRDNGLTSELELQSYFVKRMEQYIASKGKRLIGWDEILEGGLPERATVMSWRGFAGGIEAARSGHDVIMTPVGFCYFDYYQSDDRTNEPLAIGGYLPLEKVYAFNPIPTELNEQEARHILGAQANLWTEYIPTETQAEYMLFPRLCAMAEVLWTPASGKDYNGFLNRLEGQLKRLDVAGIHYRPLKK